MMEEQSNSIPSTKARILIREDVQYNIYGIWFILYQGVPYSK